MRSDLGLIMGPRARVTLGARPSLLNMRTKPRLIEACHSAFGTLPVGLAEGERRQAAAAERALTSGRRLLKSGSRRASCWPWLNRHTSPYLQE